MALVVFSLTAALTSCLSSTLEMVLSPSSNGKDPEGEGGARNDGLGGLETVLGTNLDLGSAGAAWSEGEMCNALSTVHVSRDTLVFGEGFVSTALISYNSLDSFCVNQDAANHNAFEIK